MLCLTGRGEAGSEEGGSGRGQGHSNEGTRTAAERGIKTRRRCTLNMGFFSICFNLITLSVCSSVCSSAYMVPVAEEQFDFMPSNKMFRLI